MNSVNTDWDRISLKDVSSLITKGATPTTYGFDYVDGLTEGGARFIRGNNATTEGNFSGDDVKFICKPANDQLNRSKLDIGDVILSIVGSVGTSFLVSEDILPANINQNVALIRPSDSLDSNYLLQLVISDIIQGTIENENTTSAQPSLSLKQVSDFEILLPPLEQQQKIAKILSTVDKLIEKTQTLIDKYTAIKQGMMADLFTRGIDMTTGDTPNSKGGKLRPSVEDAPELYKKTELGWVPKEWEVVLLDDISMRGSGHTPSKSFPEYWDGGIKWVSLADSRKLDDLYIYETDNNISDLGLQNSSATKHPKGTVILSRDAGIGKSAILAEEMAVSQHFIAWKCGNALDNYFLYFWLQSMKPNFNAIAMGSTIPTIGLDYFKRLKIAIPKDVNEQEAIGKRVLKVFEKNVELKVEKKKYELIKKGLMQDLLTGKVRVN